MHFFPDTGALASAEPSKRVTQSTHSASLESLQLLVFVNGVNGVSVLYAW